MSPKDAGRLAYSVWSQSALFARAVWSGFALFTQAHLSIKLRTFMESVVLRNCYNNFNACFHYWVSHTKQGDTKTRYDTNPTAVRKKSCAVISCKQMHSVHILTYGNGLSTSYGWNSVQGYWNYRHICLISLKKLSVGCSDTKKVKKSLLLSKCLLTPINDLSHIMRKDLSHVMRSV